MNPNRDSTELSPTDWEILDRHLAGESESGDCTRAVGFLVMPELSGLIEETRALLCADAPSREDAKRSLAELDAQLLEESRSVSSAGKEISSRGPDGAHNAKAWGRWIIGAGALTAMVLAGVSALKQITSKPVVSGSKTYTTAPAQRAKIRLADGSEMLLAPATKAKVTGRNVYLTGEALFTVTHDGGDPFIVYTGTTATRVLGTSFTVRRLAGDSLTKVVVAQGRVALADAVLSSGDVGTASSNGAARVQQTINIGNELAWTTGRLSFEGATLRQILPDVERWYGFHVTAQQSLLNTMVSTWLPLDNPREAMSVLATLLVADVTISGNKVTFTSTR